MEAVVTPPVTQPNSETPVVPPVTPPETPPVVTPPVTPEAITYDLKLPEQSVLQQADVDEILAYAKDKKLTNDVASMLLGQRETAAVAANVRAQAAYTAKVAQWEADVKADTDLGGANYDTTLAQVKLVMDKIAPAGSKLEGFKTLVNETGLGNHPEFVRFVAAIGKLMGEDKGLGGGGGAGGGSGDNADIPLEKRLYPNR